MDGGRLPEKDGTRLGGEISCRATARSGGARQILYNARQILYNPIGFLPMYAHQKAVYSYLYLVGVPPIGYHVSRYPGYRS